MIGKIFIDGIRIVCNSHEKLGNRKISTMMGYYVHYFERQLMENGEYEKWKNWKETFYKEREKSDKLKEILLWQSGVFKCERCGKQMFSKYKSGRFCSKHCSHIKDYSDETKQKISDSVRKTLNTDEHKKKMTEIYRHKRKRKSRNVSHVTKKKERNPRKVSYVAKHCIVCNQPISYEKRGRKTCSKQCLLMSQKTRVRWNIHRNQTSFAEKFFMEVLGNNNIKYIHEHPVKKDDGIHCYYLDFLITINGKNIDLEIDGQQHDYRKEEDAIRDKYLTECGFIVYRIKWNDINSQSGKQLMKEKIDLFLDFINSL